MERFIKGKSGSVAVTVLYDTASETVFMKLPQLRFFIVTREKTVKNISRDEISTNNILFSYKICNQYVTINFSLERFSRESAGAPPFLFVSP